MQVSTDAKEYCASSKSIAQAVTTTETIIAAPEVVVELPGLIEIGRHCTGELCAVIEVIQSTAFFCKGAKDNSDD